MPIVLIHFICGFLGLVLNVVAVKVPKMIALSKAANHPFSFKGYLSDDWPVLTGSFITVLMLILTWDEVAGIKPEIAKYANLLFILVGFAGTSIALAALSVAGKKLTAIIDVKANIADGITPPVNAGNEEGAKEIVKDENKG